MNVNSSVMSGRSNVEASSVPLGRLNAFVPQSRRIPEGPSSQHAQGIPSAVSVSETPPNAAAVPAVTFGEPMPSPRIMQERS